MNWCVLYTLNNVSCRKFLLEINPTFLPIACIQDLLCVLLSPYTLRSPQIWQDKVHAKLLWRFIPGGELGPGPGPEERSYFLVMLLCYLKVLSLAVCSLEALICFSWHGNGSTSSPRPTSDQLWILFIFIFIFIRTESQVCDNGTEFLLVPRVTGLFWECSQYVSLWYCEIYIWSCPVSWHTTPKIWGISKVISVLL